MKTMKRLRLSATLWRTGLAYLGSCFFRHPDNIKGPRVARRTTHNLCYPSYTIPSPLSKMLVPLGCAEDHGASWFFTNGASIVFSGRRDLTSREERQHSTVAPPLTQYRRPCRRCLFRRAVQRMVVSLDSSSTVRQSSPRASIVERKLNSDTAECHMPVQQSCSQTVPNGGLERIAKPFEFTIFINGATKLRLDLCRGSRVVECDVLINTAPVHIICPWLIKTLTVMKNSTWTPQN